MSAQLTPPVYPSTLPGNWQDVFIEHYQRTFNVAASAKVAQVSRPTVYKYYECDPTFRERFDNAKESAIDELEASAYTRATFGTDTVRETFDAKTGVKTSVTTQTIYSDTLAVKLLEANRPEIYRAKTAIEHSGRIDSDENLSAQDQFKVLATRAIQNYLDVGYTLELAIKTALGLGVPQDYIALVEHNDLKFLESGPVIDITPRANGGSNGSGNGSNGSNGSHG